MSKTTTMQPLPQLGDRKVILHRLPTGLWGVDVRVWKANTLRGDAYWVTSAYKTYSKLADAERFAGRFEQIG